MSTAITILAFDDSDPRAAAPADTDRAERAVRRHLRPVWRYLRMHGARADEADDLTQEAFAIAAEKDALGLDDAATFSFLRRTARFLLLRRRRGGREAKLLADAVDALWTEDAEREADGDGLLAALRSCLERLAPRSRRAVELAYGFGDDEPMSRKAIAAELELTENGVKTLMQRARGALRECLDRRPR